METMTIKEACADIDYTPAAGFENKTEAQQWSMIKAKRIERLKKAACATLNTFTTSAQFAKLDLDIQEAITCIAVKRVGGGGGGSRANVFMDTLHEQLVEINDSVEELEMFKLTKMGRGEIRAKIRENLKKSAPENRFWVELDAENECWVLIGIGEDQPVDWQGAPLEEVEEA